MSGRETRGAKEKWICLFLCLFCALVLARDSGCAVAGAGCSPAAGGSGSSGTEGGGERWGGTRARRGGCRLTCIESHRGAQAMDGCQAANGGQWCTHCSVVHYSGRAVTKAVRQWRKQQHPHMPTLDMPKGTKAAICAVSNVCAKTRRSNRPARCV